MDNFHDEYFVFINKYIMCEFNTCSYEMCMHLFEIMLY